MTKEELEKTAKSAIQRVLLKEIIDPDSPYRNFRFCQTLFQELYHTTLYFFSIGTGKYWTDNTKDNLELINIIRDSPTDNYTQIELGETINNIIEKYPECFVYRINHFCVVITSSFIFIDGFVFSTCNCADDKLKSCIYKKRDKERQLYWVCMSREGYIYTKDLEIKDMGKDILDNYNDDLPEEKVNNILQEKDKSSIIIFNGVPGCGKTSYIRHLISKNVDKQFYWLDPSMFAQINSLDFIQFLMDNKEGIIVLEDCESLLSSRSSGKNGLLSTLLNISDGMLGDALNLKFICTFNTEMNNIDTALLRKGRLKLQYEFKELKVDKVRKVFEKLKIDPNLAKEMPLCDVYNFTEDNGTRVKRKIGF